MLAALLIATGFIPGQSPHSLPPEQPATGPGGSEYFHVSTTSTYYELPLGESPGDDPQEGDKAVFWIFEPGEPPAERAPIVVFFHGSGARDPAKYGAWIEHLVRRGKIVIYPLYECGNPSRNRAGTNSLPDPDTFTPVALETLVQAYAVLASSRQLSADLERIAFCGHSIGGLIAVEAAARVAEYELPAPRVLFAMQPGASLTEHLGDFPRGNLASIPTGTLLLALAGDTDSISGDVEARRIYRETTSIPKSDKDLCVLHSDDHGRPGLSAHHLSPLAIDWRYPARSGHEPPRSSARNTQRETDALDFYGTWKLFDGLCDAAFEGKHREYALGNTPEQRYMGHWSDGRPVIEMDVLDL